MKKVYVLLSAALLCLSAVMVPATAAASSDGYVIAAADVCAGPAPIADVVAPVLTAVDSPAVADVAVTIAQARPSEPAALVTLGGASTVNAIASADPGDENDNSQAPDTLRG